MNMNVDNFTIIRAIGAFAVMVCLSHFYCQASGNAQMPSDGYAYTEFRPSSVFYDIEAQIIADIESYANADIIPLSADESFADDYVWDIDITVADGNGGYTIAETDVDIESIEDLVINIIPVTFEFSDRYSGNDSPVKNLHIPRRKLMFTSAFSLTNQTGRLTTRDESYLKYLNRPNRLPYWSFNLKNGKIVSSRIKDRPAANDINDRHTHPVYDYIFD